MNLYLDRIVSISDSDCIIDFGKYVYLFDEDITYDISRVRRKTFDELLKNGAIEFDFVLDYFNKRKLKRPARVYKFNMKNLRRNYDD